jgi:hypothetical protein
VGLHGAELIAPGQAGASVGVVDGRRDDQALPLGQQHTVGGASVIIPEPEWPTEGSGFTGSRQLVPGYARGYRFTR